jgi:lysozyme family protein
MQSVVEIAEEIIIREGGFVNDPDDPGGATNWGVTIGTMRRLKLDLTGDGQVNISDVKVLKREQALSIFLREYFYKANIDKLPEALQASVFDMNVNAGAKAITLLQELLNKKGETLKVDGVIGYGTAQAAGRQFTKFGQNLVDDYGIERRDYYYALADRRPTSRKYAKREDGGKGGWITRAEEFISPDKHLTEYQHRNRTRTWR